MKTQTTGQEIYMQYNLPKPITGKTFLLGICAVVVILALLQLAVNLTIQATGLGLLNLVYYILSVAVVAYFMSRTVFSTQAQLTDRTLTFSRKLGDSTTSVIVIPNETVTGIYPVCRGERLNIYYKQTTYIDNSAKPTLRIRAGWLMSIFSARLGRMIAGGGVGEECGWAVSFTEDGKAKVCVFVPDEEMLSAMEEHFTDSIYNVDDRMRGTTGYWASALKRTFPEQYMKVDALITDQEIAEARQYRAEWKAEAAKRKKAKAGRKAELKKAVVKPEKPVQPAEAPVSEKTDEITEKEPAPKAKEKAKGWLQQKREEREALKQAKARVKARHAQLKAQKGKKK